MLSGAWLSTLDQINLTDIYRTLYPIEAEYTFFSSTERIFYRLDHTVGHKTSLSKYKIEILPSIFSDHNDFKVKINNKRKIGKFSNMGILNHTIEQSMGQRRTQREKRFFKSWNK